MLSSTLKLMFEKYLGDSVPLPPLPSYTCVILSRYKDLKILVFKLHATCIIKPRLTQLNLQNLDELKQT